MALLSVAVLLISGVDVGGVREFTTSVILVHFDLKSDIRIWRTNRNVSRNGRHKMRRAMHDLMTTDDSILPNNIKQGETPPGHYYHRTAPQPRYRPRTEQHLGTWKLYSLYGKTHGIMMPMLPWPLHRPSGTAPVFVIQHTQSSSSSYFIPCHSTNSRESVRLAVQAPLISQTRGTRVFVKNERSPQSLVGMAVCDPGGDGSRHRGIIFVLTTQCLMPSARHVIMR